MQIVGWTRRLLVIAAVLVLVWVALAPPASAAPASGRRHDTASASAFLGSINAERSSRGLPALSTHSPIAGTSCDWNHQMREAQTLAHDPDLVGDANRVAPSWQRVGENVGVGFSISELHAAFMNSPAHRKNILDGEYTHIGICVDSSNDGRFWTTHRFLQLAGAPAPPPPPTTSPPPPPPPTTVAPTTPPPTVSSTTASTASSTSSSVLASTTTSDTTTTTAPPAEPTEAAAAPADSGGREPANPLVVLAFVIVSVGLAAATFVVGRRRRT